MALSVPPQSLADLTAPEDIFARKQSSLWGDAWRRLVRNKLAVLGMGVVVTFILVPLFEPLIAPYGESEVVEPLLVRFPPTWTWPMGLDQKGRAVFSRIAWGS